MSVNALLITPMPIFSFGVKNNISTNGSGMTNVRYALEDYRDIETVNMYRERWEAGFSHESVMESIYAKSRDNARTPMQWDDKVLCFAVQLFGQ